MGLRKKSTNDQAESEEVKYFRVSMAGKTVDGIYGKMTNESPDLAIRGYNTPTPVENSTGEIWIPNGGSLENGKAASYVLSSDLHVQFTIPTELSGSNVKDFTQHGFIIDGYGVDMDFARNTDLDICGYFRKIDLHTGKVQSVIPIPKNSTRGYVSNCSSIGTWGINAVAGPKSSILFTWEWGTEVQKVTLF